METITQEFLTLGWVSESVLVDATDEVETAESTKATFSSLSAPVTSAIVES